MQRVFFFFMWTEQIISINHVSCKSVPCVLVFVKAQVGTFRSVIFGRNESLVSILADFGLSSCYTLPSLCLLSVKKSSISTRVGWMQGYVIVSKTSAVKCLQFHTVTMFLCSVLWLASCSKPTSAYTCHPCRLLFHSLTLLCWWTARRASSVKFLLSFSRKTLICAQRCEKTTLTAIYFHHGVGANYSAPSRRINWRIHLDATVTSRHLCSFTSKTLVPTCSYFVFVVSSFSLRSKKIYWVFFGAVSLLCDSANGTTLTFVNELVYCCTTRKNNFLFSFCVRRLLTYYYFHILAPNYSNYCEMMCLKMQLKTENIINLIISIIQSTKS